MRGLPLGVLKKHHSSVIRLRAVSGMPKLPQVFILALFRCVDPHTVPATLCASVAILPQPTDSQFFFFFASSSVSGCLQRFSSPAGHFGCLIKLAPRRQLKNNDLLPLETNFLHANDIIRYIYMLFSLFLSFSLSLSLAFSAFFFSRRHHCNSFESFATYSLTFSSPQRWVNSKEAEKTTPKKSLLPSRLRSSVKR